MEAEHRSIAEACNARALIFNTKGVGGIIDNLKAVLFGNLVNRLNVADVTINVNGHNCNGFFVVFRMERKEGKVVKNRYDAIVALVLAAAVFAMPSARAADRPHGLRFDAPAEDSIAGWEQESAHLVKLAVHC